MAAPRWRPRVTTSQARLGPVVKQSAANSLIPLARACDSFHRYTPELYHSSSLPTQRMDSQ